MVMHAAKLPRLSDGYYDRNAHPFDNKGSSKSRDTQYNDKYNSRKDKRSPSYRGNSSSRSSYSKERLDGRGNRSRSPDDRRSNSSSNHHQHHYSNAVRKDTNSTSGSTSSSRHNNRSSDVANSNPSFSSSQSKDKKAEHKIEIQKSALRIVGDWSEHLSSSGKRYYYNCKSEVSKWEKPKEWIDEKAVRTEYGRRKEAQLQKLGKSQGSDRKHSSGSMTSASATNHSGSSSSRAYGSSQSNRGDHRHSSSARPSSSRSATDSSSHRSGSDKYGGSRRREHEAQSALTALQNPRMLHQRQQQDSASSTPTKDSSNSGGGHNTSRDRSTTSAASTAAASVTSQHAAAAAQNSPHHVAAAASGGSGAASKTVASSGDRCNAHSATYSRNKYGREARTGSDRSSTNYRSHAAATAAATPGSSHHGSVTPSDVAAAAHAGARNGATDGGVHGSDRRSSAPSHEQVIDRQDVDMDISPGSTPTEESVARGSITLATPTNAPPTYLPAHLPAHLPTSSSVTAALSLAGPLANMASTTTSPSLVAAANSTQANLLSALPELISQLSDGTLNNSQNNPVVRIHSAIQTLQKLQEALQTQRQKQNTRLAAHIQQLLQQQQQPAAAAVTSAVASSSASLSNSVAGVPSHTQSARSGANSNSTVSHSVTSSVAATSSMPTSAVLPPPLSSPVLVAMSPAAQLLSQTSASPAAAAAARQVMSSLANQLASSVAAITATSTLQNSNVTVMSSSSSPQRTRADQAAVSPSTSALRQPLQVLVAENGSAGSPGAESAGTPLGSPDLHLPEDNVVMTPSNGDKDASHAAGQASSQRGMTPGGGGAGSGTAAEASLTSTSSSVSGGVATLQRQESYKLPPSLANYFNEQLIPHVTGWPMDALEKQSDQIKAESYTLGNIYSTQVSCELKKARSLVRVSEIQSTLQEQRVMFLRQQVKELESMRSTANVAFMSPKAGGR